MVPTLGSLHLSASADGRIWFLTFDHGKANEIGTAELDDLDALAAGLRQDTDVRALVSRSQKVSSRGTPIFVAGANVTERVGWGDDRVKAHVHRQRETLAAVRAAPVLHVAVVSGVALGWGTEWTLTADYVLATDGAVFGLPETGLGIVPGAGGATELAARVGPCHALRLGMTGERVDADEAYRIGLVQERLRAPGEALARAEALCALAATRSPTSLAALKAATLASAGLPWEARRALEADAYARCVDGGDAAVGRGWFAGGAQGTPPWGPRR